MAAAELKDQNWATKAKVFLRAVPKRSIFLLLLNVIAPILVLGFMVFGTRDILESRNAVAAAQRDLETVTKQMDEAIKAKEAALVDLEKIEKKTEELLANQNKIREENARLSEKAEDIIARIRAEYKGLPSVMVADALYKRGRDGFAEGNMKLAHDLYEASLQEKEGYVWPYIGLGNVAVLEKNYLSAEKYFKTAVQLDSKNAVAAYNLASVSAHKVLSKWEQAKTYVEKTLELDPNNEDAKKLRKQIDLHLRR